MAERLQKILDAEHERDGGTAPGLKVAAGYDAVTNYHDAPIEPSDMLVRATMAMRLSRSDDGVNWIRRFEARAN
jgi:hypothetical protein